MDYRSLKWWIHAGIWMVILLVYLIIFVQYFSMGLSILRGLANLLPMMLLFYLNLYLVNRFYERKKYILFLLINMLLLYSLVVLRVNLNLLFPQINTDLFIANERTGWRIGALITNILILLVSTFYQILENRYTAEQHNQAVIQKQQEAQLQFLRAQINPHFLFNTLNNIYSLAVMRSEKTAEMVLKLSNLLRYVVYDGRQEQVDLSREVKQIQEYIDLFKMRSEHPLNIYYIYSGQLEVLKIEPMILIPIVENCFKHCDFDINEDAYIEIELVADRQQLTFRTFNTKNDAQQKDSQGGVGLENIRRRLELKYPAQFDLKTQTTTETFEVTLNLKFIK